MPPLEEMEKEDLLENPTSIKDLRDAALELLSREILEVYLRAMSPSEDIDTQLKAAKQAQDLLEVGSKAAAGGAHQRGLQITASLGEENIGRILASMGRVAQIGGPEDESTEVVASLSPRDAVSWGEDAEE